MLTLNRGEGGQNVMSMDLLRSPRAWFRTQELLMADRYMGVDQYILTGDRLRVLENA